MSLYSIALFLHIGGALGLFFALGLEWTSLWRLRRAGTVEQAREWVKLFSWLGRIHSISWLAILLPGIYMMATVWGGVPWIIIALAAIVLMGILGMRVSGRRQVAIEQALAAQKGALSLALRQRLQDPVLWASIQVRLAIALGIVFLMSVKPGLGGGLITMSTAVVLGLAAAWPAWGPIHLKETKGEPGTN